MTGDQSTAAEIWRRFHWAFFLDTQGLILCLQRFDRFLDAGDLLAAAVELDAATALMRASGAAMRLAGSFSTEAYRDHIRVSMTPPNVASDRFSGLMSWEHGILVALWRRLRRRFGDLPAALEPVHARFVEAYRGMADSHVHVCAHFVGSDARSLRYDDRDGIQNLLRFTRSRLALVDPNGVEGRKAEPGT